MLLSLELLDSTSAQHMGAINSQITNKKAQKWGKNSTKTHRKSKFVYSMRMETSIALFDLNRECAHQATQIFCSSEYVNEWPQKNTKSIDLGLQMNLASERIHKHGIHE